MTNNIEFTFLLPCLNEEKTLSFCIEEIKESIIKHNLNAEILVCDNNSTDNSRQVAQNLGARVVIEPQKGYGSALITGINNSKGKYIIMGDSDGSYDFINISNFIDKLHEGYDLVVGNRFDGGIQKDAMPFSHKIGAPILSSIANFFFHTPAKDFHCGLRGLNKENIQKLNLSSSGMDFASEMIAKASLSKLKIVQVPTILRKDLRDKPPHLNTIKDGMRHLYFLISLKLKNSFTKKRFLKYFFTFIFLIILFNILLFATSLIPSEWIKENVFQSSNILNKQGNYYILNEHLMVANDNFTDSLMINMAYSIDNYHPISSYMLGMKNYSKYTTRVIPSIQGELKSLNETENFDNSYNPTRELSLFLNGHIYTAIEYTRYWHGFLVFLRPLLLIFNISEIRIFLTIIFIYLFIRLFYLLKKEINFKIMLLWFISFLSIYIFFIGYSLECAPIFILSIISCIILLKKHGYIKNFYMYIFIISCIANFIDFLTVPLISLALPLFIFLLYLYKNEKNISVNNCIYIIFKSSIIWLVGYSITWITKWILVDILFNRNSFIEGITQVLYRSKSSNSVMKNINIFNTVSKLLKPRIYFILFNIIVLSIIQLKQRKSFFIKTEKLILILPFLLLSLFPIIWYFVLANHTIIHTYFIFRHSLIFSLGLSLAYYIYLNNTKTTR